MVLTHDANLTNSLEGHLTYYVSDGDLVTDSVGVPPARQFLASSLPFEDFNSICLAFANTDLEERQRTPQIARFCQIPMPKSDKPRTLP